MKLWCDLVTIHFKIYSNQHMWNSNFKELCVHLERESNYHCKVRTTRIMLNNDEVI